MGEAVTLGSDLVEAVIRDVNSGRSDEWNELATTVTSAETSIVFSHELGGITQGSVIAIDLELMYVWSVNPSGPSATVRRGVKGTTAAAHTAGAVVYVNPAVAPFDAFTAINSEIDALGAAGLYQMKAVSLTSSATATTYNLTSVTDLLDVYELRIDIVGPDNPWPEITRWGLSREMPTGEFASGLMLRIDDSLDPGRTIRVRYKAPYARLTALANEVETMSGLETSQLDIVEFGAQARLIAKRETRRVLIDSQSDTRRAAEVTAGQTARAAQVLLALRDRRIAEEQRRLSQMYPTRTRR